MYRFFCVSTVLSTSMLMATPSFAADSHTGVYVNVGMTKLATDLDLTQTEIAGERVDLGDPSVDVSMITGRVGYRLNQYFAFEGEAGYGLGGDEINQTVPITVSGIDLNVDTDIDLDIKNYYIGFARAIYPVSDQFDVFIRGGYGSATAQADVTGSVSGLTASASASEDMSGFAYGVGAQYNFTHYDGVRVDYTSLDETSILALAYSRKF